MFTNLNRFYSNSSPHNSISVEAKKTEYTAKQEIIPNATISVNKMLMVLVVI